MPFQTVQSSNVERQGIDIYIYSLNHVRSVSEFIRSIRSGIGHDLDSASADRFLKEHPSGVFFIGEQFVNCIYIYSLNHVRSVSEFIRSIRSGIGQGYQEITSKILLKYPAHYLRFIGIHH